MMNKYHIRYNTKHNESELVWRVFENGVEHLVKNFLIQVPMYGESTIEDGVVKWNVSCVGKMRIENDIAIIE